MSHVRAPGAIRMTFSFPGGEVRLESVQRVVMRALPSHDLGSFDNRAGFWVELRDAKESVLYRRVLHNPMRHHVEVYPQAAQGFFQRVPVPDPTGTFDVVVPDLSEAATLTLHGSLPAPAPAAETEGERLERVRGAEARPAEMIGRFPIPRDTQGL